MIPTTPTTTNAFALIKHDHDTIERLFREIQGADGSEKSALIDALIDELTLHMRAMGEVVYPSLRGDEHLHEALVASEVEHGVIVQLTDELHRTARSDERIDGELRVLRELVQMHMQIEQREILPRATSLFQGEAADRLGM